MKKIPLTQGQFALVDDEDFEYLNQWKWYASKIKNIHYAFRNLRTKENNRIVSMHREILKTPKGLQVDHKDHNGLNNQKSNLRNCTSLENHKNRLPTGKSKYLGVAICIKEGKYKQYKYFQVYINSDNRPIYIGSFRDEIQAAIAYDKAAKIYHGEFANLNFK